MSTYIVTFETHSETSRQKVIELLKTHGSYCPIHNYCWAIITDKKAMDIVNQVRVVMAPAERIFVIRSGTDGAWLNTYGEQNTEWLKKNL